MNKDQIMNIINKNKNLLIISFNELNIKKNDKVRKSKIVNSKKYNDKNYNIESFYKPISRLL